VKRNQLISCLSLAVAVVMCGLTTPAQARKKEPGLKSIHRYERLARQQRQETGAGARRSMSFHAFGKHFEIELEPNPILGPGFRSLAVGDDGERAVAAGVVPYKGKLRGRSDAWVRLTVHDGALQGMVWTPEEVYVFQPSRSLLDGAPADETVAYRVSDTDPDLGPGSCAAEAASIVSSLRQAAPGAAGGDGPSGGGGAVAAEAVTLAQTELGLVADYEYYVDHGNDATAATNTMLSIINQVDGIYQAQLGVAFAIVDTVVYTTSSDPFSNTTNPSTLLGELGSYRNNPANPVFGDDLVHLFTGRDFSGSTIGIAYVGAVCESYYGCGISENYSTNNNIRVVLTSHEIGHNFNAGHDDSIGSACVASPPYIMQSSVGSTSQQVFSSIPSCSPYCCSREVIQDYVPSVSCLSSVLVGTATPTPTATAAPPTGTRTNTHTVTATRTATSTSTQTHTPGPPTATSTHTATAAPTKTPLNNPPSFADLLLWLDANQITGLANGAAVSAWNDSSGFGHHAAQASSTLRPTYQASSVNGRPAVRFDGSNDYLTNSTFNPLGGRNGVTAFVVYRSLTSSGNHVGFSEGARNVNQQMYSNGTYAYATAGNYGRVSSSTSTAVTLWNSVYDGTQSGNAARLRLFLNGTQRTMNFTGTIPAALNNTSSYEVGRPQGTSSAYWFGDIAEVIVYGRSLSEGERVNVQSYLSDKYSLGIVPPATSTPTSTPPSTATRTNTATPVFTGTATATQTNTSTPPATATSSATGTHTATRTDTATPVSTSTATATHTSVATGTNTATRTNTATPVSTSTATPTNTSVATGTSTATRTATNTPVNTATSTSTATAAPPTSTPTSTNTSPPPPPSSTSTATRTRTHTATPASTATPTATATVTSTATPLTGPPAVTGLRLWLDAAQITGLNNGAAVSTWNDVSGSGHHVSQGTSTLRPVYRTNVVNGRPVVSFDGVDDHLTNGTFAALNGKTGATAFVVFKADDTAGNHVAVCESARNFNSQVYQNGMYAYATTGNYGRFAYTSTAFTIWNSVYDGTLSGNAARLELYRDGAQQALTFTGTIPGALASAAGYTVGRPHGSNLAYWDGDIAEVIVYDRTLTDAERQQITQYLGSKYGIATN